MLFMPKYLSLSAFKFVKISRSFVLMKCVGAFNDSSVCSYCFR